MPPRRPPRPRVSPASVLLLVATLAAVGGGAALWRAAGAAYRAGPFPAAVPEAKAPRLVAGSDDGGFFKPFVDAAGDRHGRLHVAWRHHRRDPASKTEMIAYARSEDGGRSWDAPRLFAGRGAPRLAVRGDTVLLVALGEGAMLRRSLDGGRTWSEPERHFRSPPEEYNRVGLLDATPGLFFLDHGLTWTGDTLVLVAAAIRALTVPVRIGREWGPGAEPLRYDGQPMRLLALRSADAGHTWSEPVDIGARGGSAYDAARGSWLSLTASPDGRTLLAVWGEGQPGSEPAHTRPAPAWPLRQAQSLDGGRTWSDVADGRVEQPAGRPGNPIHLYPSPWILPDVAWTGTADAARPILALSTDEATVLATRSPTDDPDAPWTRRELLEPRQAGAFRAVLGGDEHATLVWTDGSLARQEWPSAIGDSSWLAPLAGFATLLTGSWEIALDAHVYAAPVYADGQGAARLVTPRRWIARAHRLVRAGGATYVVWSGTPSPPWRDRRVQGARHRPTALYVTPLPDEL